MIAGDGQSSGTALAQLKTLKREFDALETATMNARMELDRLIQFFSDDITASDDADNLGSVEQVGALPATAGYSALSTAAMQDQPHVAQAESLAVASEPADFAWAPLDTAEDGGLTADASDDAVASQDDEAEAEIEEAGPSVMAATPEEDDFDDGIVDVTGDIALELDSGAETEPEAELAAEEIDAADDLSLCADDDVSVEATSDFDEPTAADDADGDADYGELELLEDELELADDEAEGEVLTAIAEDVAAGPVVMLDDEGIETDLTAADDSDGVVDIADAEIGDETVASDEAAAQVDASAPAGDEDEQIDVLECASAMHQPVDDVLEDDEIAAFAASEDDDHADSEISEMIAEYSEASAETGDLATLDGTTDDIIVDACDADGDAVGEVSEDVLIASHDDSDEEADISMAEATAEATDGEDLTAEAEVASEGDGEATATVSDADADVETETVSTVNMGDEDAGKAGEQDDESRADNVIDLATKRKEAAAAEAAEASAPTKRRGRGRMAAALGVGTAAAAGLAIAMHAPAIGDWQQLLHVDEILHRLSEIRRYFA
jgi:hypothetical protein